MKKQIRLKNKSTSLPKYSFGGDLLKYGLNSVEQATLGTLGLDFYKPKFDYDTMGKIDQVSQGIGQFTNKAKLAALNFVPGVGTALSAGMGAVQGIGNQVSNTQFKKYGMNIFQSGGSVNTQDMMPYNPDHLENVSENLIKFNGPSHDRGGIKTPAGEFDKNETILKKGIVGNPTPFAFSDNLFLSREIAKELGLPNSMANKTIADASKQIENKFETKYNDNPLQRSTKERMKQSLYTKLINANKIEFAKNREMNGIQNKEDMSFDELNSQYQSGGEIITLPNGAQMSKEMAVKYAIDNGVHKFMKNPSKEALATAGANLYSNRVAGEMRKTNGDTRDLGYDAENPQVTNRTDTQKLNPLIDLSNFNRPDSKFLQTNDNPTVNPVNYDATSLQNYRKEQLADISKEEQVQQIQPQIQQESPTYKYNNIEYKKVDDEWMWKSNKTGALHKAKNFDDDFIERNNLEPGIDKGYKYTRQKHNITPQKSIQHKTPYEQEVIGGGFPQNFGKKSGLGLKGFEPLHNPYLKTPPKTLLKNQKNSVEYVKYEDRENPYKNSTKGSKGNVFNPYDNTELSQEEMKRRYEETRTKSLITSEAAVKHGYTKQEEMNKRNLVNASKQELETYEILREDIAKNYHKDNRIKSFVQDHPISSIYPNDRSPKAIESYNRIIAQKLHDEAGVKYINPKPRVEIKEQKSYYDPRPTPINYLDNRNPIGYDDDNNQIKNFIKDHPFNSYFKQDTPENRIKYQQVIEQGLKQSGIKYQSGMEIKKYQGAGPITNLPSDYPTDFTDFYTNIYNNRPDHKSDYAKINAKPDINPFSNYKEEYDLWKSREPMNLVQPKNLYTSTFNNYRVGDPTQGGNIPTAYLPQSLDLPRINSETPQHDFKSWIGSQKTNYLSELDNSLREKEKREGSSNNFWNDMSSLEKIGLGANALSTLGQGLTMMKKDKVPTFYNENSSQVNNIMSDRNINMQPIVSRLNAQYNAASNRDNSRSWNTQRGLDANLYNQFSSQIGELGMKEQEANNQYKAQYAETLNNLGQQNVQARGQQEQLQAQTDAARKNAQRALIANTGKNLSDFAFTKNIADQTIKEGFKYLSMVSTDFQLNANSAKEFSTMLSDPEMSPIKANMESGKYQGENGYELLQSDIKAINMDPTRKAQKLEILSRTVKPKS